MSISIIIPTLNEEESIGILLQQLQDYRKQGHEIIVVDGGSKDKTISISNSLADIVIKSQPGRAHQMNKGAAHSSFDVLWFLHADTLVPDKSVENIEQAIHRYDWGRFNITLSGKNVLFRIIEKMINIRSCMTGIATGDQGIFVKRQSFETVGGYFELPLMEDVELCKKLKVLSKPTCLKDELITSSRRWEKKGIFPTVLLMWKLRFLYWIGVSADRLATQYQ